MLSLAGRAYFESALRRFKFWEKLFSIHIDIFFWRAQEASAALPALRSTRIFVLVVLPLPRPPNCGFFPCLLCKKSRLTFQLVEVARLFLANFNEEKRMKLIRTIAAAGLVATAPLAASAQDHSAHGGATSFPEVCKSSAEAPPAGHPAADAGMMADHQKEAMAGMMTMDRDMMQGMMKEDPDVAFVCGMIAHHQGAIDMANVELKYGDDQWATEMAQKVIDAQTREIADMTAWLKDNAK